MMKNITKLIGYTLGVALLLQGCDLDRDPNDYVNHNESYRTLKDAEKWDNGIYSTLRGKFGGGYVLPQEVQADMLNAHASYRGLYGLFHGWDVRSEDETLKAIYHSYYAALVDANIVISTAPALKVTPQEQSTLDVYLGNAHFARAFYYFNLALRWGRPYKKETEATDLCVPLEKEPFSLVKQARATNREVYEFILDDLAKAEEKLAPVECEEGSEEITKDAVKALRARVYLYMGRMEDALAEAEYLIAGKKYPLIPALAEGTKDPDGDRNPFVQMWQHDSGKEQIWQPFVEKPNEVPTTTDLYGADLDTWKYWKTQGEDEKNFNKPAYLPTGTVMYELFKDDNDRRVPAYFEVAHTTVSDKTDQAVVFVIAKFKGNPKFRTLAHTRWGGYVPNGICAPKPFRIAEQYLIAAEAAYETGQSDKALMRLNELRVSRGLPQLNVADDRLQTEIREERARELAFEGFRLWDLRRWNLPMPARIRQGTHPDHLVGSQFFAEGFDFNKPVPADNPKFIWGFPKDEVAEINKKIVQNQGWE